MNVAPAHPKPQVTPGFEPHRNVSEQREEGKSFEAVLAAALQSPAVVQAPVPGGEIAASLYDKPVAELPLGPAIDHRPTLRDDMPVAIGEDAVRFDARPVVGRSFVPDGRFERPLSVSGEPAPVEQAIGEIVEFGPDLQRALSMVAPRLEARVRGPVGWSVSAPLAPRQTGGSARSAAAQPGEAPTLLRTSRWIPPESPSAAARAPGGSQSELRAQISLTFLGDEVLVAVRGLDLSADEEEALADEARSLLSSSDFGERTLRVVTSRRA